MKPWSKSSTLISDSHASLKNAKDEDLNESNKSPEAVQENAAEDLPESAKKYEVVEEERDADVQNEENASKLEAIMEPVTGIYPTWQYGLWSFQTGYIKLAK